MKIKHMKWWKSKRYMQYNRDYNQLPRSIHSFKWSDHYLYRTWHEMKARCYDESNINYCNYGGRGITISKKWLFDFERFVFDMGDRPDDHTIDRIDNDGNYKKSNCKWSNRTQQNQNKRVYKTSKTGYGGIRLTNLGYFQVKVKNTREMLGVFKTLEEALIAQENKTKQTAPRVTNTTGLKGVTMQGAKFLVRKVIDGKRIYLGNTSSLIDAKILYDSGIKQERKQRVKND